MLRNLTLLFLVYLTVSCTDDDKTRHKADASTAPLPATWTMMGKDATNTYHQTAETKLNADTAKTMVERWRFTVDGFSTGSAAIAEGKVFILASGGLYAVDLDSGRLLWSDTTITGTASPAYIDGELYVHSSAGANLYKLRASDGTIAWGPIATYPQTAGCDGTSSPVVAMDKVLVGHCCGVVESSQSDLQAGARGGVEAFSRASGERAWTYWTVPEDGENGAMVWSTVGVDVASGTVFATTGNNYTMMGGDSDAFHAIDLATGDRKWVKQVRDQDLWSVPQNILGPDTDFGANPIIGEVAGHKFVAAGDKGSSFWVVDRDTGEVIWNRDTLSARRNATTGGVLNNGAFDGKNFYVASNQPPAGDEAADSILHVLSGQDGSDVRDPVKLGTTVWGALSLANGLLFVPANTALQIYDTSNGELLNQFETGGTIAAGAPAIADGNVIVKSGLQYIYAQDAVSNNQVICYGVDPPVSSSRPTSDAGGPSGAPTFSAVFSEVFKPAGCAGSELCHAGTAGGLTMTDVEGAYKALVGVEAQGGQLFGQDCSGTGLVRVVPGDPDASLLVQKLAGTQTCGSAMPIGGMISADQLQQVRAWISAGAHDD